MFFTLQATDSVVEFAVEHGKAFAVVPCCVFPRLFRHRRIPVHVPSDRDGAQPRALEEEAAESQEVPVLLYEQLVEYLRLRGGRGACIDFLPFEGMNRVVYRLTSGL